jgi:hypothetical protein
MEPRVRSQHPFQADDLAELDERLLAKASAVVGMQDSIGRDVTVIGMRHDVDNALEPALAFAEWEAERGYQSTYYILHTAPYWDDKPLLRDTLDRIDGLGHEIGFHTNALAAALRTGRSPEAIVWEALDELRGYGYPVTGVVAHGDQLCHQVAGGFVNDELFAECVRPTYGLADRTLEWQGVTVKLDRISRADFGLEYDPNWVSRALELSDSGGRWHSPFDEIVEAFPYPNGQLHMLIHPCWWRQAF